MSDPVEALVLDLLEWIGPNARPYAEVIEAWRTSCPRLPVWEEANERGFIAQRHETGRGLCVFVSGSGATYLMSKRHIAFANPASSLQDSAVAAHRVDA